MMWRFSAILQLPFLIASANPISNSSHYVGMKTTKEFCLSGQYLDKEANECKPCPSGHYMPDLIHSQLRCYPCEKVSNHSGEVILASCTKTQATTIGCKEGYFLRLAAVSDRRFVRCYPCTVCSTSNPPSFQIKSCGQSFDTVCCPRPDMAVVERDGESGYECQDPNLEKVSQTELSSQSPKLFDMPKAEYLLKSYVNESKEVSSTILPEALENITNGGFLRVNFVFVLIIALSLAFSVVCNVIVLFQIYKTKKYSMKPSPLTKTISNLMKDSQRPLLIANAK